MIFLFRCVILTVLTQNCLAFAPARDTTFSGNLTAKRAITSRLMTPYRNGSYTYLLGERDEEHEDVYDLLVTYSENSFLIYRGKITCRTLIIEIIN